MESKQSRPIEAIHGFFSEEIFTVISKRLITTATPTDQPTNESTDLLPLYTESFVTHRQKNSFSNWSCNSPKLTSITGSDNCLQYIVYWTRSRLLPASGTDKWLQLCGD